MARDAHCFAPKLLLPRQVERSDLIYRWNTSDLEQARLHAPILDELAGRLLALGWGVDIATATAALRDSGRPPGYETFVPAVQGSRTMRTITSETLAHLREAHEATRNRVAREGVDPILVRPASQLPAITRPPTAYLVGTPRSAFSDSTESLSHAPGVTPWRMRHMAGQAMDEEFPGTEHREWIESHVMGHTPDHELGLRISYVPLPSIGHKHSDGGIRRTLLVEPPGMTGPRAEAFRLLQLKSTMRPLTRAGDRKPEAILTPRALKDWVLDRYLSMRTALQN